jgi:Uri superfamily endonuclease
MAQDLVDKLLPVAALVLGILLTELFNLLKLRSEERRWYADHFLDRKVGAFAEAYAALLECQLSITEWVNDPNLLIPDWRATVRADMTACGRAVALAGLYLEEPDRSLMEAARKELWHVGWLAVGLSGEDAFREDLREMETKVSRAVEVLRDRLYPQSVRKLDKLAR